MLSASLADESTRSRLDAFSAPSGSRSRGASVLFKWKPQSLTRGLSRHRIGLRVVAGVNRWETPLDVPSFFF